MNRLRHFFKGTKCLSIVGGGMRTRKWYYRARRPRRRSECSVCGKGREDSVVDWNSKIARGRTGGTRMGEKVRQDVFQSCLCERRMRIDGRLLVWGCGRRNQLRRGRCLVFFFWRWFSFCVESTSAKEFFKERRVVEVSRLSLAKVMSRDRKTLE